MALINKEIRTYNRKWEVREEDGRPVIEGYAAVFNSESLDLGGFTEIIVPGAFAESLANPDNDVVALVNHNDDITLGRLTAGTVKLREDDHGLLSTIYPPSWAAPHVESIKRGDYGGMSFGFYDVTERWEGNVRYVTRCVLVDVSVISCWPAYPDTTLAVRSWKQQQRNLIERDLIENRKAMIRLLMAEIEIDDPQQFKELFSSALT